MSYSDTIRRIWNENILYAALVELTYRCNLDCYFCYNDTALRGVPLTFAQYRRFFEDLRDLGTLDLTLTGGEPLAHPEFFALGRLARDLGFVVRVKSNAHALRGKLAQRMKDEVDPFVIEVSLHGATPETHDRQTRVPGSFVRLVGNLRRRARWACVSSSTAPSRSGTSTRARRSTGWQKNWARPSISTRWSLAATMAMRSRSRSHLRARALPA